jgi:hypothetical protein
MAPVVHPVVLPAPSVTAQIGFPPVFDLGQLLRSILASLPPFLQNVFRPIFDFFISQFCVFFNNCASP